MTPYNRPLFIETFEEMCKRFEVAGVLTKAGNLVYCKFNSLSDIGTIAPSAMTAYHSMKFKPGDVILLNDPYSAGTHLNSYTLVTQLPQLNNSEVTLFFAVRFSLRTSFKLTSNIETEGMRIPPTQIAEELKLNDYILEAILKHPACPKDFLENLKQCFAELAKVIKSYQELHNFLEPILKKDISDLFANTEKKAREIIASKNIEPSEHHFLSDSGESIHMKTFEENGVITYDLDLTSHSETLCLTNHMTFGAAIGATIAFLDENLPINAGLFHCIKVLHPFGCLADSHFPSPTLRGSYHGVNLIASMGLYCLCKSADQASLAQGSFTPSLINFQFSPFLSFFDSIPGGWGASERGSGIDAYAFWSRSPVFHSIEETEKHYPIHFQKVSYNKLDIGNGKYQGGKGLVKHIVLDTKANVTWCLYQMETSPHGEMGAQDGSPAEIYIKHKDGTKEALEENEGTVELEPGTLISISSPSGGGWGVES